MKLLLAIKSVLMRFAKRVAFVIAMIVSFLFYWLILGPYAILLRIAKPDMLELSEDPKATTYWRRLPIERKRPGRPY